MVLARIGCFSEGSSVGVMETSAILSASFGLTSMGFISAATGFSGGGATMVVGVVLAGCQITTFGTGISCGGGGAGGRSGCTMIWCAGTAFFTCAKSCCCSLRLMPGLVFCGTARGPGYSIPLSLALRTGVSGVFRSRWRIASRSVTTRGFIFGPYLIPA